jgi:hypothetical protein
MLRSFMGNLQETLIETIEKDFKEILTLEDPKVQRKEFNILLKRIITAKNLLASNVLLLKSLTNIESKIKAVI